MPKQTLNITAVDPVQFVERLLEAGKQGAVLKPRTFPRLKGLPFAVELELDTDVGIPNSPGVNAIPVPMSERIYSKEELEEMDWDLFREAVQSKGIRGRQREVMQVKYLKIVSGEETMDEE